MVNYKFDLNHKPEELSKNNEAVDKLLQNFSGIALQNSQRELISEEQSSFKSNYVPQKGLYIVEIEQQFFLLDYAIPGYEPKPVPLIGSNLIESRSSSKIPTPSTKDKDSAAQSKLGTFLAKKGLLLGLGLGILLTIGANKLLAPQTANQPEQSEQVSQLNTPAQTVTTTEVATTDINSTLDVSGTVTAFERIRVMSQAAGLQITEVLVERGDYVRQGQILSRLNNRVLNAEKAQAEGAINQAQARLDELRAGSRTEEIAQAESKVANAQSAIAQAESDLELVRKRVERNTMLRTEGAISQDRLDEIINQERVAESNLAGAKANLNEAQQVLAQRRAGSRPQTIAQAQAELAQAKGRLQAIEAQLADTIITAPRAGTIASREAQVGQTTSTSEVLFTIIQDGRLELKLQVPETLIGEIQLGQKVKISSNSNRDLDLTGKVREIDPLIDDNSRQATVKVDLPKGTNLKPGMFLQAKIDTSISKGQVVPIEALLPQSDNVAIAFVVQPDNTVKAQKVIMGEILAGQQVEIIEGLNSGDRIVLQGAAYLKDGDQIAISQDALSN